MKDNHTKNYVMSPENLNHSYKNIKNLLIRKGEVKNHCKYFEANIFKNKLVICKYIVK